MSSAPEILFKTLADPTRRALFERLCREGEKTVGALTAHAGVSQPVVSKHLGLLKQAGLVRDRHEGRQTHYSAQLGALAPLIDWTTQMAGFWEGPVRRPRRPAQENGPMTDPATETRSVVVEREVAFPPEKIWRALTQPHLIEEWLMKNDFEPVAGHRFNLRREPQPDVSVVIDCEVLAVEPNRTLSYSWQALRPRQRGDLDADPDADRHPSAHGAVGLPARSAAGLSWRTGRLAAILTQRSSRFLSEID